MQQDMHDNIVRCQVFSSW